MGHIYFLGDSITAGAWDERGGWCSRVSNNIAQHVIGSEEKNTGFYCVPYNLGIAGNTVPDVIARIKNEITARVNSDVGVNNIQIVIAIGCNDSVYLVDKNKPSFTDQEFHNNLQTLVDVAKDISDNISFIGLTPVDDDILNPIPWASDKAYANEHVKRFEDIIAGVCEENSLKFLPMFDRWVSKPDYKKYLIDGVHPNSNGHKLMSEEVVDFLINEEFIKFHTSNPDYST